MGKVYSGWFELGESLKTSTANYKERMLEKHQERWTYGDCPFFQAAYMVDPEFVTHNQASNEEVVSGFMTTLERLAILFEVRALQKKDGRFTKSWEERAQLIKDDPMKQKTWQSYPKYPSVETAAVKQYCATVNSQLTLYHGKKGVFARSWVMESAEKMPAHLWWDQNGASVPELQAVARMILAQPASASICERINSEFAFIKDRKRNRLGHDKANKLVGLFHNLRLIKKMKTPAYTESAVGWNQEDDKSGITKWGVTHY